MASTKAVVEEEEVPLLASLPNISLELGLASGKKAFVSFGIEPTTFSDRHGRQIERGFRMS